MYQPAKLSTMATSSQSVLLYIVFGGGFFCVGGCQLCHSKNEGRARTPNKLEIIARSGILMLLPAQVTTLRHSPYMPMKREKPTAPPQKQQPPSLLEANYFLFQKRIKKEKNLTSFFCLKPFPPQDRLKPRWRQQTHFVLSLALALTIHNKQQHKPF